MAVRLDRNTLVPVGFAVVILGAAISLAYFAGGSFERLSKFDPVKLEVRLTGIEIGLATLGRKIDLLEQRRAMSFPFPHKEIAYQPATPEAERKDAYQKGVLHWPPVPVRGMP